LAAAHAAAFGRYGHTPVVVGIDIYNLEAEAYGATVAQPDGEAIPAITTHPCRRPGDVLDLAPPAPSDGRIGLVLRAARRLAEELVEADVRVPVSGPFSIAAGLLGFEALLTALATDPAAVRSALEHLADGQVSLCRRAAEAGVGVTLFESAATPPLVAPAQFRAVELPALRRLTAGATRVLGRPVPCILGGDTARLVNDLLALDTGYLICPHETDQAAFLAAVAVRPDLRVRINMDPGVIARGPDEALRREVDRVLALAGDRPNVCLGSGVLPYETPPEHVDSIRDYLKSLRRG